MLCLIYVIKFVNPAGSGDSGHTQGEVFHVGKTTNLNRTVFKLLDQLSSSHQEAEIVKVVVSTPSDFSSFGDEKVIHSTSDELPSIIELYRATYGAEKVIVDPDEVKKPCCTRCGRNSHTAATCFARSHLNGEPLSAHTSSLGGIAPLPAAAGSVICYTCHRPGHYAPQCPNSERSVQGIWLPSMEGSEYLQ